MDLAQVLIELSSLSGPSGFEDEVTARVRDMLGEYLDESYIDTLGNVIGVRRCGRDNAKRLLLDAHIDENGFIVTGHEEGFLRVAALGGIDIRQLPASEVTILTEPPLYGVIGTLPPHVLKADETEKLTKLEDMFIDIGMTQEEAAKAVPIATPVVFRANARRLGDSGVIGKAIDDRAGLLSILRALELLKDKDLGVDIYVMASVQEEVGVRGAGPGAFTVDPDYCIVIDVGQARTPDVKPHEVKATLGGGAIISRGPNMDGAFVDTAIKLASENDIKYQLEIIPVGSSGTNARAIQISREGVKTALFGIPLRYMHSVYESVQLSDIEDVARLISLVATYFSFEKEK